MKLSELISDMREVVRQYGDLDVEIATDGKHTHDINTFIRIDGELATDFVIVPVDLHD